MATIRQRGKKWQVQVRRAGSGAVSKSFLRRKDADARARKMEIRADRSDLPAEARSKPLSYAFNPLRQLSNFLTSAGARKVTVDLDTHVPRTSRLRGSLVRSSTSQRALGQSYEAYVVDWGDRAK